MGSQLALPPVHALALGQRLVPGVDLVCAEGRFCGELLDKAEHHYLGFASMTSGVTSTQS